MLYLNNFTETKPLSKVLEEVHKWEKQPIPEKVFEESVKKLYQFVGAGESDRFVFVGSEGEAAASVLYGTYFDVIQEKGANFLYAPATENASILQTMDRLTHVGCELVTLPVNEKGQVTVEILEKYLSPKASILALSWINPLTGVIQPVWELGEYCKSRGIYFYVQGSEISSNLSFQFQDLPVDFLSISGDLMHGPKGSGALFIKNSVDWNEVIFQGGGRYSNPPALMGLAIAAEELQTSADTLVMEMARLRQMFEDRLEAEVPSVVCFGKGLERLPNVSIFGVKGIHSELMLHFLKSKEVVGTRGGGRMQNIEHHLCALGYDPKIAKTAMSFSFSLMNSEQDIEKMISAIKETVEMLNPMILENQCES